MSQLKEDWGSRYAEIYLWRWIPEQRAAVAFFLMKKGEMCSVSQKEFKQYFPKPGWVEQDANEIWASQLAVAVEAMQKINVTAEENCGFGNYESA